MKKACTEKDRSDKSKNIIPVERIEGIIYFIRNTKVMLDRDLAMLYRVETRTLVQAVKRNIERFPEDFMFQLTKEEFENWRSQIVMSNSNSKMGLRWRPYAFTEQGATMLSGVLRSPQAAKVNIEIMRAFIKLRQIFSSHKELSKELNEMKDYMLRKNHKTDRELLRIWRAIEKLTKKPKNDRKIGFDLSK